MSIFWIKQPEQGLVRTGNSSARTEWDDGPEGKKVRTDRLARDEATGFPLWEVEVAYTQVAYGRASLVTAKVLVPCEVEPTGGAVRPGALRRAAGRDPTRCQDRSDGRVLARRFRGRYRCCPSCCCWRSESR